MDIFKERYFIKKMTKIVNWELHKSFKTNNNFKYYIAGDLHGNVFKLINHLYHVGFISKETKENLILNVNDKELFKKSFNFIKSDKKLILLGDCFADRNKKEIQKLDLLYALSEFGNDFTLIYGNHDHMATIQAILKKKVEHSNVCKELYQKSRYFNIYDKFNLIFKKHYKLIEVIENKYMCYHAPIHYKTVKKYLNSINVKFENIDINLLANLINDFAKSTVRNYDQNNEILIDLLFARRSSDLSVELLADKLMIESFCGHDSFQPTKYLTSLDNQNGKSQKFNYPENIVLI